MGMGGGRGMAYTQRKLCVRLAYAQGGGEGGLAQAGLNHGREGEGLPDSEPVSFHTDHIHKVAV